MGHPARRPAARPTASVGAVGTSTEVTAMALLRLQESRLTMEIIISWYFSTWQTQPSRALALSTWPSSFLRGSVVCAVGVLGCVLRLNKPSDRSHRVSLTVTSEVTPTPWL